MDVYAETADAGLSDEEFVDAAALATDLSQTVTRFRRALQRAARAHLDGDDLSPTEVELLLLVAERPGCGVAAAATELGAAPNTVSTLIRKLVSNGLLRREFSRGDRRVARLLLTEEAEGNVERWRNQRADVLVDVIAGLDGDDRAMLRAAVPVLEAVSAALYQPRRRAPKDRVEATRASEPAGSAAPNETAAISAPMGTVAPNGGESALGPQASVDLR